jgi:hypothetical protein
MTGSPDDTPGEAELRAGFVHLMEMLRATELDEDFRPKLRDAVEGRITREERREYLRALEERRKDRGFPP